MFNRHAGIGLPSPIHNSLLYATCVDSPALPVAYALNYTQLYNDTLRDRLTKLLVFMESGRFENEPDLGWETENPVQRPGELDQALRQKDPV